MTEQPSVNVYFYGTTLPTPEQQHELMRQLTEGAPAPRPPGREEMLSLITNGCAECRDYWTPALTSACASVGIERGKSTALMLYEYLAAYHERGHKAA